MNEPVSLAQLEANLKDVNEITRLLCWEIVSDGKRLIELADALDRELYDYMAKASLAEGLSNALAINNAPDCEIAGNDDMQLMTLSAALADFCDYMNDRQKERKKDLDELFTLSS